ncbi:MAG: amino acid synthesis family protein [Bacillota bacterium]|nr:amino acid synthesis family protein [Bacillota bacterium]
MSITIRKKDFFIEKKYTEMGHVLPGVFTTAAIAVTGSNPYAGRYSESLSKLSEWTKENAKTFLSELLNHTNLTKEEVSSFGKAAIVGVNGEYEHGAALTHPTLGKPTREFLDGTTVMPSVIKVGLPGCTVDVPVDSKDDPYSLDYIYNWPINVSGSPMPDEFVLIISIATNARPLPRNYEGSVDLSALD